MDTQGLRTDRLLHVRVLAEEERKGQAKGASVVVTKGRFSEDKRRFMERSETFALRAGAPVQGNVKVLALGQVLDDTTDRLSTCFVVRGQTGDKASLALCRLVEGDEEDDTQKEDGGGGSGRRSQHVTWEVLKGGEEELSAETCTFAVVPGPCVLAWNSVYESSTQAPRMHCWYRGKWHVYLLRTTSGVEKEDDSSGSISFEGSSTQTEGGFLFRVTSSLSPSSFAWSVLPASSSSVSSSSSSSSRPANDTHVLPSPYPWLPASTLESCSCLCEPLAFNHDNDDDHHHSPPSEIYTATSNELSFLSSSRQPPEEPVCRALFSSSSSSPPTQICALLARTQTHDNAAAAAAASGGGGANAVVIEHVAILFTQDPLQRLLLFARVVRSHNNKNDNKHEHEQPKQELHLLREFQGIASLLRGDFLGSGWDQLALLPPPSSSSSLSSSSSSSMGEVGLTDLVHVWGHKGCCTIEDAPLKLLDNKAGFRSADKARRKAAAAAAVVGGGTTVGKKKKRPLVEQQPLEEEKGGGGAATAAAAAAAAAAVAEKKERVLGKNREALRERLRDEEAERRRLARVEEQKQVLLRESQGVLTTMAYQEVLPAVMTGLVVGGSGGMVGPLSFASSLRPVMATNEEHHLSSQQQSAPLLPIASHRILQQEVNVDAQRVALDVVLCLRDMTGRLRLEEVSLAVFSQHGPLTFSSSTIKDSSSACKEKEEAGEEAGGGELRLQVTFNLSAAALLDPVTWLGKVTLCCAWRRLTWKEQEEEEEEEEETVYPPGAQPLQQLTFSARGFYGASSSNGTSGTDLALSSSSSLPLLWKLDAALLSSPSHPPTPFSWSSRLASVHPDPTQHTCNLAAIDLPTLCTTLHNLLQQRQDQAASSSYSSSTCCSLVPSALVQPASSFLHGLASTVALLQQELDLLCTLVEGGEPEAATIRDVWLAQPALDVAVYTLANLCLLD